MKVKDAKVIPIQAIPREVKGRPIDEVIKAKRQARKEKIKQVQQKLGLCGKS